MMKISGEQHFDKYIMIAPGSDYGRAMWSDIGCVENAVLLNDAIRDDAAKITKLLHHVHFSFALNRKFTLPLQSVWKHCYSLESVPLEDDKRYCIIFTDISASRTDMHYLNALSKKKNVTLVMIMVNTVDKKARIVRERMPYFSMLFSFDRKDCEKYHAFYHPQNYSVDPNLKKMKTKHDAFFVGMAKARLPLLTALYDKLKNEGADPLFFISGVDKKQIRDCGIRYNEWLDYKSVLQHTLRSNCVIEVVDATQVGVTLRTMEAICYNKRLLTNNRTILDSPFYKSGFIQVFDDISDIDIGFVKDRSPVDYHYDGVFSPIHLLEHINQIYGKRRSKARQKLAAAKQTSDAEM